MQKEEIQNEQLIQLSVQILELTDAVHKLTVAHTGMTSAPATDSP